MSHEMLIVSDNAVRSTAAAVPSGGVARKLRIALFVHAARTTPDRKSEISKFLLTDIPKKPRPPRNAARAACTRGAARP